MENVQNKNKFNLERELEEYKLFVIGENFIPYGSMSFATTFVSKDKKIGSKIVIVSVLLSILWFIILIGSSLLYMKFYGPSPLGGIIALIISVVATIVCFFCDVLNRKLIYSRNFTESDIRYVCFTNDYRFVTAYKNNEKFELDIIYHHFTDCFVTNTGWSTSFKVYNNKMEVIEYYEIISRYTNNYSSPLYALLAQENDFSYWKMDEQLDYYRNNGSEQNYVDEIFIINNSNSAKKT